MNKLDLTNTIAIGLLTALALVLFTAQATAQDTLALTTDKDKLSYALGMDLGNQLRSQSVTIDAEIFGKALADALAGGKTRLTPEQAQSEIAKLQTEMQRRQAAKQALSAPKVQK